MHILKRAAALLAVVLLTACSSVTKVTDFEHRSVAYGWVDIKDVEINHVSSIYIQQYRPKTDAPYYTTGFKKFKDGFLFWTVALPTLDYSAGYEPSVSWSSPPTRGGTNTHSTRIFVETFSRCRSCLSSA